MKRRHPERIILLLTVVCMLATVALHAFGFLLHKPQLLYWGRWACFAMVAVSSTPLVPLALSMMIEKCLGSRHD